MLNKICLMGRLTADPELKKTSNGTSVVSFTLAVNRTFNREETDWVDIVAWQRTAEFICDYFSKGQMMALEGRLQTRTWQDKQGGNHKTTEVIAEQVFFAESKKEERRNTPVPQEVQFEDYDEDGELPF